MNKVFSVATLAVLTSATSFGYDLECSIKVNNTPFTTRLEGAKGPVSLQLPGIKFQAVVTDDGITQLSTSDEKGNVFPYIDNGRKLGGLPLSGVDGNQPIKFSCKLYSDNE